MKVLQADSVTIFFLSNYVGRTIKQNFKGRHAEAEESSRHKFQHFKRRFLAHCTKICKYNQFLQYRRIRMGKKFQECALSIHLKREEWSADGLFNVEAMLPCARNQNFIFNQSILFIFCYWLASGVRGSRNFTRFCGILLSFSLHTPSHMPELFFPLKFYNPTTFFIFIYISCIRCLFSIS